MHIDRFFYLWDRFYKNTKGKDLLGYRGIKDFYKEMNKLLEERMVSSKERSWTIPKQIMNVLVNEFKLECEVNASPFNCNLNINGYLSTYKKDKCAEKSCKYNRAIRILDFQNA